jgi:hypothetical protein
MKIEFDDGSFLEFMPADDGKLHIILCGFKTKKQLTMASSELTKENAQEIIKFLQEWCIINK